LGLTIPETERRLRIIERLFLVLPDSPATYGHWRKLVVSLGLMSQVLETRLVGFLKASGLTELLTLNPTDFGRYPSINPV
jgi:hypothetical protein